MGPFPCLVETCYQASRRAVLFQVPQLRAPGNTLKGPHHPQVTCPWACGTQLRVVPDLWALVCKMSPWSWRVKVSNNHRS